jgi:flagellar export protein FliJ
MAVLSAEAALKKAQERVAVLTQEIRERNEELIKNNYQMAQEHLRTIKHLNDKLDQAKKDLISKQDELEQARLDLIEAQQKLEAMEKLKEKRAEEYYLEQNRLDQKRLTRRLHLNLVPISEKKPKSWRILVKMMILSRFSAQIILNLSLISL